MTNMSKIIKYQLNIKLMGLKCQFYPSNEGQENVAKMLRNQHKIANSLCFKKWCEKGCT